MRYTKFQKFISSFLLFLMLGSITFRIPILNFSAFAGSNDYYDLVSIIVDEETYSKINSQLKRYSRDISGALKNTKVIILPVPNTASPFDIASMNEALYYDGYKALSSVSYNSRLVGTILVGNIPLPIVSKDNQSSKTILPYTDFESKSYIYDKSVGMYNYNNKNTSGINPEIWHGVISPNTGNFDSDIQSLKDYFDKNTDFYNGNGIYDVSKNSINGKAEDNLSESYEPYVFYFDSFRESKSLNYNSYIGYQAYLENKEDISYKRFTKELAQKLKEQIISGGNEQISDLAKKVDPNISQTILEGSDKSLDNIPDIQSRYIINNSVKSFIEVFSKGAIGELRKNVFNAGRYNYGTDVNVDFIPYIINVLDIVNDEIIKEFNTELENEIDNLVKNGLSRNIAIPTTYYYQDSNNKYTYENYLFGKKASTITKAEQCSIYRGSLENGGNLVEANRGLNIHNTNSDRILLESYPNKISCFSTIQNSTSMNGAYGMNTPFNLDKESSANGELKLANSDNKGAIRDLYDIGGAKQIKDASKINNPFFCIDNNYLLSNRDQYLTRGGEFFDWVNTYKLEAYTNNSGYFGAANSWSCNNDNNSVDKTYNFSQTFDQNFLNSNVVRCAKSKIILDGKVIKERNYSEGCSGSQCECSEYSTTNSLGVTTNYPSNWKVGTYNYKSIPSYVFHKSPTSDELGDQIDSLVAPSLPVDKNRYVDFISANGDYNKINYPHLYRLKLGDISDLSLDKVSISLDKMLDDKSTEINTIINNSNPSNSPSGSVSSNNYNDFFKSLNDLFDSNSSNGSGGIGSFINHSEINKLLSTGNYPSANFDLKSYLKAKGNTSITLAGETKIISHYDMLVFAIYWNNLNSVSAKYGYVFENYLTDQVTNSENYFLPKNKNQYEIAYLGSSGDASNMYIGLDPESKGINPYSSIIGANQDISTKLLGLNIGKSTSSNEALFKCAPPEGVPIWEWIPAVMCRLGDMLPPTISISDGACGISLLSNEEREELYECDGDINKNGVNDCLEYKLGDAEIVLESDSDKFYYNKFIPLRAILKGSSGNTMTFLNSTEVKFDLIKLEVAKNFTDELSDSNKEVIFDINDSYKNDYSLLTNYLTFNPMNVKTNYGIANYGFSVKDKDLNITLKSTIEIKDNIGNIIMTKESNDLILEVRGDRLFSNVYKLSNIDNVLETQVGNNFLKANSNNNIYLFDGVKNNFDGIKNLINNNSTSDEKIAIKLENFSRSGDKIPLLYPIEVSLYKGKDFIEKKSFTNSELTSFMPLFALSKSGNYTIQIKDGFGSITEKSIDITPNKPSKLDLNLSTNLMQSGGNISTNFVTILDIFGNPVSGEFYDLKLTIDGNGVIFLDNNKKDLTTTTYEGYNIFRLKSEDKIGTNDINISLFDSDGKFIVSTSKELTIVDEIKIEALSLTGDFKVGGEKHKYQISVRDKSGKVINNFNSRVYMNIDSMFVDLEKPYFEINSGIGIIELKTKTIAGKEIPLEIQIEGLNTVLNKSITIFPDNAIKMDLVLSKTKMEASPEQFSILNVELKDRYNNLVFNDSNTLTNLEILPEYSHIITSNEFSQKTKEGKSSYRIYSTVNPGIGYFKVSTNPSLELNSFTINDENGNLVVNGVGENAGKIESFYVWNKHKLSKGSYNALYTTLLGSNYGDIDQVDYLAGSIIFDKNSKALAVTSLLNNSFSLKDTFSLKSNGGLVKMYSSSDLSQDISTTVGFDNNKIFINLFNNSLNTFIGKIYYNFLDKTNFRVCDNDILSCTGNSKTTIVGASLDDKYVFYNSKGKLYFRDYLGKTHFEIDEKGNFLRQSNLSFSLSSIQTNGLLIDIKSGDNIIGNLLFDFVGSDISVSRDELSFNAKKTNSTNSILLYLNSTLYGSYFNGKGNNSYLNIYYNDPFGSSNTLNTFSKGNNYSYENFENKAGLGWEEGNKTLLSFSAGNSVGESLKNFASFSTINIGDPVISLKKIQKTFNNTNKLKQFDSTIGRIISDDPNVVQYKILDYNNNGLDDIILIKNDGYIKLLENSNVESGYIDMGNLASIVDLGNHELLHTGDFTGDGFDDIFFIGVDGKPYLLNNINKDFSRLSLSNKFNLNGNIIRTEVFDMDNDGIDDIITLDDAGEINIFYGGGFSTNPSFTKLTVSDDYGLKLSGDIRNDLSLVYFDGLYQLDSDLDNSKLFAENEAYLAKLANQINNGKSSVPKEDKIDYELVNSLIYEEVSYSKNSVDRIGEINLDNLSYLPNSIEQTTFIKGEYSDVVGLKVEKTFIDKNGGFLSKGDIVDIEIKLTNSSGVKLNNIAYIEDVIDYFQLDKNSMTNSKNLEFKIPNNGYDFLIDGFSLSNNESIIISYSTIVKPLKYAYIQVGYFEDGEEGDDLYGDILLKDSLENCGTPVEIFRSVSTRLYQKGIKNPSCDTTPLPDILEKNSIDSNGNGIPDYIEELTGSNEALQEYSNNTLAGLFVDSNNNGIPDDEEKFTGTINLNGGSITKDIDEGLDGLQDFVNGLSCGFNNGACFASPLNWAPLAPGGDPTFNGEQIGDGLNIDEGYPIFSAFTWMYYGPICGPTIWPVSVLSTGCSGQGAGGSLGVDSPSNFFRLFITPTLTGGIGLAACFGSPASVAGNLMMPGIAPLFPGGNCIVVAKPIVGCSNDGSDGNPSSIGYPMYGNNFGVINGNCSGDTIRNFSLDPNYVSKYYNHINNGGSLVGLSDLKGAISDHTTAGNGPMFEIGGTGTPVSVTIDQTTGTVDYSDITKIVQKRIQAFPGFLMNWVTRQIEEIVNKLTDFPTIFIILPDFSGIFDVDLTWEENKQNWQKNSGNKNRLSAIEGINISNNLSSNESINSSITTVKSGIKDAYEFIGSLPLVKIEQQPVDMVVPWISVNEINKTILSRQQTIESRKKELTRAQNSWTLGSTCNFSNAIEQQKCIDNNAASEKISFEITGLIGSLEANLEVINDYKNTPEKINKLISKKEDYLEQILCNVENISNILGGRIGKNGERFKAWVELYILIKAILKSWQMLIDVFIDYEEECKECKNERQDLIGGQFELISMVIPDIPVIRFPKWPDIIIDLHNIRAGLNIALPEFNITTKPILLPELPDLYLPDFPDINIILNLPDLPILPTIEIPELPDLPTLPTVELPDLPPPPTLPKMFAQLEAIVDILKLVTKAMCILKSSPFVPEWRAGDQIAFLTERNGYLPTDFLNISMPQFSFPWIDAIKVTTYVNLEFETEFIVELARQIAMPINDFTSDFTNLFNISTSDLDFRNIVPNEVDINIGDNQVGMNSNSKIKEIVGFILTKNILLGNSYIKDNKDETVSNLDFKKEISRNLANPKITNDPRYDELRELWTSVFEYSFSGEDKIIKDLQDNNFNKFQAVSDIINTEIIKNTEFKNDFNDILNTNIIKTSASSNSDIDAYNSRLTVYNESFFKTTENLVNYDESTGFKEELKQSGEELLTKVNTSLGKYTTSGNKTNSKGLLADILNGNTQSNNSCSGGGNNSEYGYNYEGIYILENDKSYRLFDYKNELSGKETTTITDFDNDGDEDLLYFVNNVLYLKENLKTQNNKTYQKEDPIIVTAKNNKFLNGSEYYPAVNNVLESVVSSGIINTSFLSTRGVYNYRLSFFTIIDKFMNLDNFAYVPQFRKKSIIDAIAGIGDVNFIEETDYFIERKDLVYIDNTGDLRGVSVFTDELKNISDDLNNGNVVVLSNGTYLYSGDSTMILKYLDDKTNDIKSIIIPKNRNIEIKSSLKIVGITGNGYVRTGNKITLEGTDILNLRGKPLFVGTKISYIGNDFEVRDNTYIDLKYYDNSKLGLSFKNISDWELYNLGSVSNEYLISISRNNDYYYSKLNGFKNNILSTSTNQVLLSPQIRADNISPEISLNSIKVPVYQKREIDLTNYIFENSGLEGISQIYIDFDLDIDSSGDGNPKNDDNSSAMSNLNINLSSENIILEVGPFQELIDKKIGFTIIDNNGNIGYKEVNFEIYSPNPEIDNISDNTIIGYVDENLNEQPVSLFRYRGGQVSKLANETGNNLAYTSEGDYDFILGDGNTGLTISKNGNTIATINENTGKIITNSFTAIIDVIKSNSSNNDTIYPKIIIKDGIEDIFYQTIKVNGNKSVKVVDDFENIKDSGVYVKFLNKTNYNFYILPENIPNNPGTLSVYRSTDLSKESLFTVFNDGRINTINDNYILKYDFYDDYVVLKLLDKHFNREVASVLYKIDSEYIIK